jgi:hypothetical protein
MRKVQATVLVMALVTVACGGADPAVEYDDAPAIIAALDEVGMGCADEEVITIDPSDPDAVLPGLSSLVNCSWPTEERLDLPGDFPAALVYASEADRLSGLVSVIVHGCAAAPPVLGYVAYAHGETWVFQSGFGTIDRETMEEAAEVLGGEVVATTCGDVPWINRAVAAKEAGDVAEMKAVLGER